MFILFLIVFCLSIINADIDLSKFTDVIELPYQNHESVLNFVKNLLPENVNILEAGGFDGTDTLSMKKFWPNSTVYVFEPVYENYQIILNKISGYKNIFAYPFAINIDYKYIEMLMSVNSINSNIEGASTILEIGEYMHDYGLDFSTKIIVPSIPLDVWKKNYKINPIDFIWFDLQGAELIALKSGINLLKDVKVVYCELNFSEIFKNQVFFDELNSFMENNGFKLIASDFPLELINLNKNVYSFGNVIFKRI